MEKDAMIVVNAGMKVDATLTDISLSRVLKGVEVYKLGDVKKVVMSGGGRGPKTSFPATKTEAQIMKESAIKLGIPSDSILLEEKSKDLLGSAYFTKILYLEPSDWKNIIVITSDYHQKRADYVFKKILGPDYSIDFIISNDILSLEESRRLAVDEEKKLALAKEWLGAISDGDSPAIEAFIYHFHPYYSEKKKISNMQLRNRLRDY
jgi:uncharacterized SAM-binding protein YcdF (DUF218 family)